MEIQQSSHYAAFIKSLGWNVEKVEGTYIYIKPFPLIGGLAKLQRAKDLFPLSRLIPILKRYNVKTLAVEPDISINRAKFHAWIRNAKKHFRINTDYFLPTKTIRVDLRPSEQEIFHRFTEAKRRAVRRAKKLGIVITKTHDIETFVQLKNQSAGMLGFITTTGIKKLWQVLPDKNKLILVAHPSTNLSDNPRGESDKKIIAGIFLILWNQIAYYWVAGATHEGKKLFAPTLLVWEALKESKKMGCRSFDFVGAWDERLKNKNSEWKGFTKFKEGFGGTSLYYPLIR